MNLYVSVAVEEEGPGFNIPCHRQTFSSEVFFVTEKTRESLFINGFHSNTYNQERFSVK